jgi:hypothetical protein
MLVGAGLVLLGGVAGLLAVLLVLMAISARNEPEGTASFIAAFFALPLAATTTLSTAAASLVYARYGAKRRAAILGIVAALSATAGCVWLYVLT